MWIKRLISRLTKPKDAVWYHGDMFIQVPRVPVVDNPNGIRYKYHYQRVKQNRLGVWKPVHEWLSRETEIKQTQKSVRQLKHEIWERGYK